jgi:hypothetical protein
VKSADMVLVEDVDPDTLPAEVASDAGHRCHNTVIGARRYEPLGTLGVNILWVKRLMVSIGVERDFGSLIMFNDFPGVPENQ